MWGVGLSELAVIAFVAVLVFGPDRLPMLAKQAGQWFKVARRFAHQARDELRNELGPEYADLELRSGAAGEGVLVALDALAAVTRVGGPQVASRS